MHGSELGSFKKAGSKQSRARVKGGGHSFRHGLEEGLAAVGVHFAVTGDF